MVEKKAAAKKSAAPKTAAKKTTGTRKAAPRRAASKDAKDTKLSASEVAEQLLDGSTKWGTGRDRDTNLANEGYDLDEIRREVQIVRGRRMANDES